MTHYYPATLFAQCSALTSLQFFTYSIMHRLTGFWPAQPFCYKPALAGITITQTN